MEKMLHSEPSINTNSCYSEEELLSRLVGMQQLVCQLLMKNQQLRTALVSAHIRAPYQEHRFLSLEDA